MVSHIALRPHTAISGGRHSSRSALRPWPTARANVDLTQRTFFFIGQTRSGGPFSTDRPGLAILACILYHRPEDTQADGQTEFSSLDGVYMPCSAVKYFDILNSLGVTHECDGRTDGIDRQTDRYIPLADAAAKIHLNCRQLASSECVKSTSSGAPPVGHDTERSHPLHFA